MQNKTKNKLSLLAIVLLFSLPVLIAVFMNSSWSDYQPEQTKNKGHFVSPPVKLEKYTESTWTDIFKDKWTLLYRHEGVCGIECMEKKTMLHKIRLTMANRADKLALMVVSDGKPYQEDVYSHIKDIDISNNELMQEQFKTLSSLSYKNGAGLYVVAPEGYIMMSFSLENTPSDIIKDLKLLVKRKG